MNLLTSPAALALLPLTLVLLAGTLHAQQVRVSLDKSVHTEPVTGRVLLLFARPAAGAGEGPWSGEEQDEPRFQVTGRVGSAQVFGIDVHDLAPGEEVIFDADVFGYPIGSLADMPGEPLVAQVVFHVYEKFEMAHGHTLELPMDRGEGQHWNRAPGNLISAPSMVQIRPRAPLNLVLDRVIPPIEEPEDTEYIKHIRIKSELLSKFWGRPMYVGAHVLLPHGFADDPKARYPLAVFHGHFPRDFGGFRPEPPDPDLEPDYSTRFGVEGYNLIRQQEAHDFYERWTGPDFPRFLIIEIQHANPFYDDSYAVNSANLGPYGDALTYELIPYIEEKFQGIGEGWARFLYGGSTGGWEALAVQIFYPDEYNGCFAACPDPIDFRAYTLVDIYADKNAYWMQGPFAKILRPGHRDSLGSVDGTILDWNHMELALGTKGRSGDQYDIWQAVYSPVGPDGYPAPIWDKLTGEIDPDVAAYWREHYDLRHILERDWKTLGPKLEGKLHIFCGDMDNYYLNNAVYLMEDFLQGTIDPHYAGNVDYGDRAEHCWNGDQENPNHISRLRYNTMYLPRILERLRASAPPGYDLSNWR